MVPGRQGQDLNVLPEANPLRIGFIVGIFMFQDIFEGLGHGPDVLLLHVLKELVIVWWAMMA